MTECLMFKEVCSLSTMVVKWLIDLDDHLMLQKAIGSKRLRDIKWSSTTGLPIGYSVIVALTGVPIGYSVIVALTGVPIGYT